MHWARCSPQCTQYSLGLSDFLSTLRQHQPPGNTRCEPRRKVAQHREQKAAPIHVHPSLRIHSRQGTPCRCSLLCGAPDAESRVLGGELRAHMSYHQCVLLKALATCHLFPHSDKISRIETKFRFPFHVCYSPCLSCFFPILSIRGSPQFKNGNETWPL